MAQANGRRERRQSSSRRTASGDKVKIHYTGTLGDGTVFDSSRERDPLEFTVGEGQVIEGFEKAVVGMSIGESKQAMIPAAEAYGPRHDEMIMEVERTRFPEHIEPEVGQTLQIDRGEGRTVMVTVAGVTEASVTIDANHPLAGKDLTFDLELVEIG